MSHRATLSAMDIEKYFAKALDCQKNDQADLALTLYQEILDNDPKHLPTLYNMATIYGEQGNYTSAQKYYDKLLAIEPDYVRAYYNLALCHLQQKNIDRAENLLRQAIHLVPDYSAAQHMLGSLLFKKGKFRSAKKHFEQALLEDEAQGEVHCHLGMTHIQLDNLKKAEAALSRAIELMPYLAEAQYHMGVIRLKEGNTLEAEKYFQEAADRDPLHFGAFYNLGLIKKQQGFLKLADEFLRKAQEIEPENEDVKFLRAALDPEHSPEQPPTRFVEDLFDRYAQYYDQQMQQGVHYNVPSQLYSYFEQHINALPNSLSIVDLGCGTGLTGERFKHYAKQLIGIDISKQMLAQAEQKKLYDDLWHKDIIVGLEALSPASVDVIIAGDVLGYMGTLDVLFQTVESKLKFGGYWLFSLEVGEQDHALSEHIRFTHSIDYIQFLCDAYGLSILLNEHAPLRIHQQKELYGQYFIAEKN